MNLFLIGYRGSGKTTVARLIAEQLDWPWFDADVELERRAGQTIQQIFATSGEMHFRDLEEDTLAQLSAGDQQVIALGGGVVLREDNRATIAASGKTVWLQAPAETLYGRISIDPTTSQRRPNLTAGGGLEEVQKLLEQRTPLYEQCANLTVETFGRTPAQIANDVVAWLERQE